MVYLVPDNAIDTVRGDIAVLGPIAEQCAKTLSLPLWKQFALVSKGHTIEDGERAAHQFLEWLKSTKTKQERTADDASR